MHFIIGLILLSIFLGFLFSPKGSDFQTIVKKGFISLLIMGGVLAVIGGIWYGIDTYQSKKKKEKERQEQIIRQQEIADIKAKEKLDAEKKLAAQLKDDPKKNIPSKKPITKPVPGMDIMGKWSIETESFAYFTFAQVEEKITASKFKWFADGGDRLIYTVKGIVDGKSVTFDSNKLRGTLTLKKKSYDRLLIGEVKENGQSKAFVIKED